MAHKVDMILHFMRLKLVWIEEHDRETDTPQEKEKSHERKVVQSQDWSD